MTLKHTVILVQYPVILNLFQDLSPVRDCGLRHNDVRIRNVFVTE